MDKGAVKLAPSILAADFARLGDQVAEAERAGADRIHVDVMDGHFVPNISMGAPIIRSLRKAMRLPLEAHLMISNPDLFVDEFAQAGTDSFLSHGRATKNWCGPLNRFRRWENGVAAASNRRPPPPVSEAFCKTLTQSL